MARRRHERLSQLAPELRADRDVLEVRIRRRQPARRRDRLAQHGVHATLTGRETIDGRASTYVDFSFCTCRCSRIAAGSS